MRPKEGRRRPKQRDAQEKGRTRKGTHKKRDAQEKGRTRKDGKEKTQKKRRKRKEKEKEENKEKHRKKKQEEKEMPQLGYPPRRLKKIQKCGHGRVRPCQSEARPI